MNENKLLLWRDKQLVKTLVALETEQQKIVDDFAAFPTNRERAKTILDLITAYRQLEKDITEGGREFGKLLTISNTKDDTIAELLEALKQIAERLGFVDPNVNPEASRQNVTESLEIATQVYNKHKGE